MNNLSLQEIWQVEVGGQIYEANFSELTEWISDGSLQPEDKIRRGNLRWIEARKAPALLPFFNAKESGSLMPVAISTTDAGSADFESATETSAPVVIVSPKSSTTWQFQAETKIVTERALSVSAAFTDSDTCQIHPDRESRYICGSCSGAFCKDCPNTYGSVKICPTCGQMCQPSDEIKKQNQAKMQNELEISGGFGFSDFVNALAYPFRFKTSLFFGAAMFTVFSLGQSASGIGGIYLVAGAIFCMMLANMLTFGILANTINNFSQGRIGLNFMPDFDDFSIWDDMLHPFFISLGVYISSFGAFIIVISAGMYLVISSLNAQTDAQRAQLEVLPGTPYYNARDTVQQSNEVKKVLEDISQKNKERLKIQQDSIEKESAKAEESAPSSNNESNFSGSNAAANMQTSGADTEEDVKKANDTINQIRKTQLESTFGKSPDTRQREYDQIISGLLKLAAPLVVIGFLTLLWGLFYFPAACAVAGYTKSFLAAINPMIGLDTIKRLGTDYIKILLMGFLIIAASIVAGVFSGMLFSAFDLPSVGNIPARIVGSLFGFYLWIVFSCILGFALYKASDRLKLYR